MKKTILISMLASSVLFADALTDVAVSKATEEAKTEVVKQVAGSTGVSDDVVKQAADAVSPEASAEDKLKNAAVEKVAGATGASATDAVSGAVSGGSMTDKAVDIAVEKTIGDNAMAKDVAKKAVNTVVK
jgi:predicted ribonuclease toxin of YeeF-YezG toxin-antitoxin module